MTISEKIQNIKNAIYIKDVDSDHLIINNKLKIEIKTYIELKKSDFTQISKADIVKLYTQQNLIDLFSDNKMNIDKNNSNVFNSFCSFVEKEEDGKSNYSSMCISNETTSAKSFINNFYSPKKILEKKLRNSYYQKLITKNITSINLSKKLNYNIFIYDWDDTLFPTTFLSKQSELTNEIKEILKNMETHIKELLNESLNKGYVFIITNSRKGWVEDCAKKFYPNLEILKKIDIISARDLYENESPYDEKKWKERAFLKIKEDFKLFKENIVNLICIGDSEFEIEAGKKLSKEFCNVVIKNIKLKNKPNLNELMKEISWMNKEINRLYSFSKNLSIELG